MESFTDFVAKKEKDPKRTITEGISDDEWNKLVELMKQYQGKLITVSDATLMDDVRTPNTKPIETKFRSKDEINFTGFGSMSIRRDRISKISFELEYGKIYIRNNDGTLNLIDVDTR